MSYLEMFYCIAVPMFPLVNRKHTQEQIGYVCKIIEQCEPLEEIKLSNIHLIYRGVCMLS